MDPVIHISSADSCPYSDFNVDRAARSKSTGSVVLRKIAKKLSRISVKGGRGGGEGRGGGVGGGGSEEDHLEQERGKEPAEKMEKFKRGLLRSSRSTSNLDSTIDR